jgi:hypothetical protein
MNVYESADADEEICLMVVQHLDRRIITYRLRTYPPRARLISFVLAGEGRFGVAPENRR